jgi:hypothetical protein
LSNYWTPTLYVHLKDGTFKPVPVMGDPEDNQGGMTVYYLQRPEPATEKLKGFPEGFRMLAGDSGKRTVGKNDLATKAVSYACLGANQPETNFIPNYKCPSGMRAQIYFPSCWNGKDNDAPDHKSHMSYPNSTNYDNGPCPSTHPVKTIGIFFEVHYDTALFDDLWDGDKHPFVFANGDATGYGFHGDFVNGWDVNVLQKAVDTCTNLSGQVSDCAAVSTFAMRDSQQCQIPTVVKEPTGGILPKLPGCNAGTPCTDDVVFGPSPPNYVDLTITKKWSYAGCGSDEPGDRAMNGGYLANDDMTVDKCVEYCAGVNMPYAGLEFGRECFCADKLDPRYAPKEGLLGSCGMNCTGDAKQICGGVKAMSIYHKCDGSSCVNAGLGGVAPSKSRRHAREIAA